MAGIVSTRILALQATSPRVIPIPIVLTADTVVTGIGTVGGINTAAVTANSTANSALALANAGYGDITTSILGSSGTAITMTSSSLFRSGSGLAGVFIGAGGLIGKNSSGATTFAVDGATGAATFSGALNAASGTFAGNLTSGGNADVTGYLRATGTAASGAYYASVIGAPADTSKLGVHGKSASGTGVAGEATTGIGVYGYAGSGKGIYGIAVAGGTAVYGIATNGGWAGFFERWDSGSGPALRCARVGGGDLALEVGGRMEISSSAVVNNLNADLLDGQHASAFAAASHTHTGVNADLVDGYHAGSGYNQVPVNNGVLNSTLNADMLDGYHASDFFRYTSYGYGAPATNAYITVNVGGITVRVPVAYP